MLYTPYYRWACLLHKIGVFFLLSIFSHGCKPVPRPDEKQEKEEKSMQEKAEQAKYEAIRKEREEAKKLKEEVNRMFMPQVEQPNSPLVHTRTPEPVADQEYHDQEEPLDVVQSRETPIDPQEILEMKLNAPETVLTSNQSISLVNHCAQLGEQNAAMAKDKEVCLALGNTGVGKSTFLNGVVGHKLKLVRLRELGLKGMKKVIIVDPDSTEAEAIPIGHGRQSRTFLPQIAVDPDSPKSAYCDCPGFADNRGEEINIANTINIRKVLRQASNVKAVFLIDYNGITDNRDISFRTMEGVFLQMFGNIDNLRRHQNTILLGVTKAPLYEDDEPITQEIVRSLLTQKHSPIAQVLANRTFLFDPFDRATDNHDFWSPERCRNEIAQLDTIPQNEANTLFQTVLNGDDQTKLMRIIRDQSNALAQALEQDDYETAGNHWQLLEQLKVIGSDEVEQMVKELAGLPLKHFVLQHVRAYTEETLKYNFEEAEQKLILLRDLLSRFSNIDLNITPEQLDALLKQRREAKAEGQRNTNQKLVAARREGGRKAREETEQITQQMLDQLETIIQQMGISESEKQRIRAIANDSRDRILE